MHEVNMKWALKITYRNDYQANQNLLSTIDKKDNK